MNESSNEELLLLAEKEFLSGNLVAAKSILDRILLLEIKHSKANELIAYVLGGLGESASSIRHLEIATQSNDCTPNGLYEYGSYKLAQGQFSEAIVSFERGLMVLPDSFELLHDLGVALAFSGKRKLALEKFELALLKKSDSAELYYNIGCLYDDNNEPLNAIRCYENAIALNPHFTNAWLNKGLDLAHIKRYQEAISSLEISYQLDPTQSFLYGDILLIKMRMCDWGSYVLMHNSISSKICNNENPVTPFAALSIIDKPNMLQSIAEKYAAQRIQRYDYPALSQVSYPGKKIRVAYFSSDFYEHPVSLLILGFIESHCKNEFEIHAFSLTPIVEDAITKRLRSSCDYFHAVENLSDIEVVEFARNLHLDVAINLNGYTDNARLEIFAIRIARVQASYLGFLGTMGSEYFDYLIADRIIIPEAVQKSYSEKILYLPTYYSRDISEITTPINNYKRSDFNLPEDHFIFCSFNNNYKITPEIFNLWLDILKSTERSVLLIYVENDWSEKNLGALVMESGICSTRVIFARHMHTDRYLARLSQCDLFLDTYPYNAGTTANDALWMGLPVLTMSGSSFQSRVASSLLTNLGLTELVTTSPSDYAQMAIKLASHPELFTDVKNKLISNSKECLIFNPEKFCHYFEIALRAIHARSSQNLPAETIYIG